MKINDILMSALLYFYGCVWQNNTLQVGSGLDQVCPSDFKGWTLLKVYFFDQKSGYILKRRKLGES